MIMLIDTPVYLLSTRACTRSIVFSATASSCVCQDVKGVKGIPSNLSKEVNVKYRFFMDETYSVTPKSKVAGVTKQSSCVLLILRSTERCIVLES